MLTRRGGQPGGAQSAVSRAGVPWSWKGCPSPIVEPRAMLSSHRGKPALEEYFICNGGER
jgi:hypothetical protein